MRWRLTAGLELQKRLKPEGPRPAKGLGSRKRGDARYAGRASLVTLGQNGSERLDMPDKSKLRAISEKREQAREQAGPKAQHAVLLYARWRGMTEEDRGTPEMAKQELDQLLDGMEPEDWQNLHTLARDAGEPAIRGLMSYSLKRASEAVKQQAAALEKMGDWPMGDAVPRKDKRKDRER